ncbi:hypothetical protein BDV19DRAFT_399473 [Aspergillus venezuelensis]
MASPFQSDDRTSHADDGTTIANLKEYCTTIFQALAEEASLHEWLRAAIWWALRGKAELDSSASSGSQNVAEENQLSSKRFVQGMVNLAKAWWICHDIVAQDDFKIMMIDPRIKNTPQGALIEQYRAVVEYLRPHERRLADFLCSETNSLTLVDVDKSIWVFRPTCTEYKAANLEDRHAASTLPPIAFGDVTDLFCYKSEFAEVTLFSEEDDSLLTSFQCVLSIVRHSSNWSTTGIIASQTPLVQIEIQSDNTERPAWKDIEWDMDRRSMLVKLRHGFFLNMKLSEDGFEAIWHLAHHIVASEGSSNAKDNEDLVYDDTIKSIHYIPHDKPVGFPIKPTLNCRVRLFKKTAPVANGTWNRRAHHGLRIHVATPPEVKEMHQVSHDLPNSSPLLYSLKENDDTPGLVLHLLHESQGQTLCLYFNAPGLRSRLLSKILGLIPGSGEIGPQTFALSYVISEAEGIDTAEPGRRYFEFGESIASVIEQKWEREPTVAPFGKAVFSESLRVIIETRWGSITDRINIAPKEFAIALTALENTVIQLYRMPQSDFSMSVAKEHAGKDLTKFTSLLETVRTKPTIRELKFKSQEGLHIFQEAVTGFRVQFDSLAARFIITRRRKLLPLTKKWDTNITRVQVVKQRNKVQIVAFFYQFARWKTLKFLISIVDEFEKVEQKGEYGILIKDAKYAPPQDDTKPPGYVCLSELEYPTEHDDITIFFEDAAGQYP